MNKMIPDPPKEMHGCLWAILLAFLCWVVIAIIFEAIGWTDFI